MLISSTKKLNQACLDSAETISDAEQFVRYIEQMSGEMSKLAKNADLPMLSYLLGMAEQEASECSHRLRYSRIN